MTKRRRQSKAEIAARLDRLAKARASAVLERMRLQSTGAEAETIGDGTVVRARRIDAFRHLLERRAIAEEDFNAVRAYERDLALAAGSETPERTEFVDRSCEGAPGQNITQAMIDAGARTQWVKTHLSQRDWNLLTGLLASPYQAWRAVVERETGEFREDVHAAMVRGMAANLKDTQRRMPDDWRMAA